MLMATEPKTYVPGSSARLKTFSNGKSILKLGFHAEKLIAFIREHTNERGYVNLGISERRQVSEHKDTHCVWLDTWKPEPRNAEPVPPTPPDATGDKNLDDVPF